MQGVWIEDGVHDLLVAFGGKKELFMSAFLSDTVETVDVEQSVCGAVCLAGPDVAGLRGG